MMKKKIFNLGWIVFLTLILGLLFPSISNATVPGSPALSTEVPQNSPSSTPMSYEENLADVVEFRSLHLTGQTPGEIRILRGPVDSLTLNFNLPPDWDLMPGASLNLKLATSISSVVPSQGEINFNEVVAGQVKVSLNGVLLENVVLKGNQNHVLTSSIPENALVPGSASGNELMFQWDASQSCGNNMVTSLSLDPGSKLIFPHKEKTVNTDIIAFPQPFYLESVLNPVAVTILVPDQASSAELQAALTVVAGLGRMSRGNLQVNLVSASRLDSGGRDENNLIFIGNPDRFSSLSGMLRSLSLKSAAVTEDGIIQMFVSPWNPGRAVLLVGGGSDPALIKSAQAVSTGSLLAASAANVSIVKNVVLKTDVARFSEDRTFADYGQTERTFIQFGSNKMLIPFNIPAGTEIGADGYLDLVFNHSQLVDYLRSGIVVRLNNTPIASVRFSDTTALVSTLRANLPSTSLRNGANMLEIQADLFARDLCSDPRLQSNWINIYSNSLLHLPVIDQPGGTSEPPKVGDFPQPFSSDSTLSDTIFILSKNDFQAWDAASQLAFTLGKQTDGRLYSLQVLWGDVSGEDMLADKKNVILIGIPDQLPVLGGFKGILPVSFDANNQVSSDVNTQIQFETSSSNGLGYLLVGRQAGKTILAVLGSSVEGMGWAVQALLKPTNNTKLMGGNFAVLQRNKLLVESIQPAQRTPIAGVLVEGDGAGVSLTPGAVQLPEELPASFGAAEAWIMPVMAVSSVLIILLILWRVDIFLHRRKRR